MIGALKIDSSDHVVELAPGVGRTAEILRLTQPASYTAIERDPKAGSTVRQILGDTDYVVFNRSAEATGLDDGSATVVFGEAFLTMQPEEKKKEILREAHRILRDNGRYGRRGTIRHDPHDGFFLIQSHRPPPGS